MRFSAYQPRGRFRTTRADPCQFDLHSLVPEMIVYGGCDTPPALRKHGEPVTRLVTQRVDVPVER